MRNILRMFHFLLFGILIISSEWGFCFLPGDIDGDKKIGLSESINALQIASGMKAAAEIKILVVPSDEFPTIQSAIDAATEGDTIQVEKGTYNENLTIAKDKIILQGSESDTTIIKGDTTNHVVMIENARRMKISGFTIREGIDGIRAIASSVEFSNLKLEQNKEYGLNVLFTSFAKIENISATNNTGGGAKIDLNSSALIMNSQFSGSDRGLKIEQSSSASAFNCEFYLNDDAGILVEEGASIEIESCKIFNNSEDGLEVDRNSTAFIDENNLITQNSHSGIFITHGSQVTLDYSSSIISNNYFGINLSNNSTLFFEEGIVNQNTGDGVLIHIESSAQFGQGASVTNNGGFGVNCNEGKNIGLPGTMDGNTFGSTNCN